MEHGEEVKSKTRRGERPNTYMAHVLGGTAVRHLSRDTSLPRPSSAAWRQLRIRILQWQRSVQAAGGRGKRRKHMRWLLRVLDEQVFLLGTMLADDRWLAAMQATTTPCSAALRNQTEGLAAAHAAWTSHICDKEREELQNRLLEEEVHRHWKTSYPRQRWDASSESE